MKLVNPEKVTCWQDINRMIETGFVQHYNETPIVQNNLFGHHSYLSVRIADATNDEKLALQVEKVYRQFFELPTLPDSIKIFAVALQIADKVYSMDYSAAGTISGKMAEEAIIATEAYLGTYLPKCMPRVAA